MVFCSFLIVWVLSGFTKALILIQEGVEDNVAVALVEYPMLALIHLVFQLIFNLNKRSTGTEERDLKRFSL
jgi:hypothetical protein